MLFQRRKSVSSVSLVCFSFMASAAPQKRMVSSVFITLASPYGASVTPTARVHSSPSREQPLRRSTASQDGQIDPPAPAPGSRAHNTPAAAPYRRHTDTPAPDRNEIFS